MRANLWHGCRSVACGTALAGVLMGLQPEGRCQSDNFNSGTDNGWTHLDLSAAGLPPSSYTFPSDGTGGFAYRIFSPAPPVTNFGPARAFSYRSNVYADFHAAVDLVAWDTALNQACAVLAW